MSKELINGPLNTFVEYVIIFVERFLPRLKPFKAIFNFWSTNAKDGWAEKFVKFSNNSYLDVHKTKADAKPEFSVNMLDMAQFIWVGEYTYHLPNKPKLAKPEEACVIAVPRTKTQIYADVLWLKFNSAEHLQYFKL